MKSKILIAFVLLVSACTSKPYTVKSTINEGNNQRIDRVCTNKRAIIPWYIGVAAGFFTYKYGEECNDVVKAINDPTAEQEEAAK